MDIPEEAVRRLERLRELADAAYAASRDVQARYMDERAEIGRHETDLQRHARGRRLEVEGDDPVPFYVVEDRRQNFSSDPSGRVVEIIPRRVPLNDPAATLAGRLLIEARARAAAAARRREELSGRAQVLGQVVRSCEDFLRHRGWREGSSSPYGRVTGVGGGGLRVNGDAS
jgi:hypothetical protein